MRLWQKRVLGGLGVTLGTVFAVALWCGWLQWTGNYHMVIPGELYRTAQFDATEIAKYRDRDGIRSILNLRGADPGNPWYDAETAESKRLGITHADFRMSASRVISPGEATRLIALMRALPKPILIHCLSGSDRTGLASALYVAAIAGQGEEAAESQLSLRFGHFSVPVLSSAYAMDDTWERLEPALGFPDS